MASDVGNILSGVQQRQLFSIQTTARSIGLAQLRLSTGLRVNSALENPQSYFSSRSLLHRANDVSRLLDGIGQNLQVIKAASRGIEAAQKILDQAEAYVEGIRQRLISGDIDFVESNFFDDPPDNVTLIAPTSAADFLIYDAGQDGGGTITITDDEEFGPGFVMDGNYWRRLLINYNVTADTVLEFDFRSTNEAEIAALGFDNDTSYPNDNRRFYIHGTQTSGITYAAPVPTFTYDDSGDWVHVEIPVGAYFTGNFSHLTTILDDDGAGDDGEAQYRGMFLREGEIEAQLNSAPQEIEDEYVRILSQLDLITEDASYRGINLLHADTLKTVFNEDRTSYLETEGIIATYAGLGLETEGFASLEEIEEKFEQIRNARLSLRAYAETLANDLSVIQTRETFSRTLINVLKEGSDGLILADQTEEGARLLSLQTRQQIQFSILAIRPPLLADLLS